jgi:ribosomal protein S18 acetylase RimI-like enzyme
MPKYWMISLRDNGGIGTNRPWPSKGEVYDYLADRQDVRICANDLANILSEFYDILVRNEAVAATDPAKACKAKTSIIAHSMGSFLAQEGLWHLWKRKNSPLGMSFVNQMLMVAGGMDKPKPPFFDPGWPVIRMLVVAPPARGKGLGRRLTEACILRAHRDGAPLIALHTTPVMEVALAMYQRLGFLPLREAPPVYGVPYSVYIKTLTKEG